MQYTTVNIALPPLLIKFLKYRQANSPEEPLCFHKQHFVNKFLKAHLININSLSSMSADEQENAAQYLSPRKPEGTVSIAVPMFSGWHSCHKKRFIPVEKKRLFVKIIKAMYKYEFEQFFRLQFPEGKSKQKIADLWLEQLHIDGEILPKSQWRQIYREITI